MTSILQITAFALVVCALPLALYIMISERTANFQKIWDLPLGGNELVRVYIAIVVAAFLLAVVAWFFALTDHRAAKKGASAASNHSFQRITYGVR